MSKDIVGDLIKTARAEGFREGVEAAAEKWFPIKSAKKSPDPIFVGWWDGQTWTERRAWWDKEFEYLGDDTYRGAWTDDAVKSFGYEEVQEYNPTHWRQLPQPPNHPARSGGGT